MKPGASTIKDKAMRKSENSVIPCSAEINLNGISTVGNLTEINWTYKTWKFRRNLTEILTEMFNRTGTGNNRPELSLNGNKYKNSVITGIFNKST